MTASSRNDNAPKSPANGNVCSPAPSAQGLARPRRWTSIVRELRNRKGLTQSELASQLGVTQASVSRWENGSDLPSVRLRKTMREMMRVSSSSDVAQQIKARLRYTPNPVSLVGHGARFLDFSPSFASETGTEPGRLRGATIYGRFGEIVDETTQLWERSGIFSGEVAMTLTVLSLKGPGGASVFLKNFDTPHLLDSDEVITICETRRITKSDYDQHLAQYGRPVFFLSYDEIAD